MTELPPLIRKYMEETWCLKVSRIIKGGYQAQLSWDGNKDISGFGPTDYDAISALEEKLQKTFIYENIHT